MAVSKQATVLIFWGSGLGFPLNAFAHTFFGDTQPLLNGAVHPFLTVSHLLLLLAIGLYFMSVTDEKSFLLSFMSGLCLGCLWPDFFTTNFANFIFALLLLLWGFLVVYWHKITPFVVHFFAASSAFVIGVDSVSGTVGWFENIVFYSALVLSVTAFFSYILMTKNFLKSEVAVIAIKSLGGWLFAIGLIMLAFLLS